MFIAVLILCSYGYSTHKHKQISEQERKNWNWATNNRRRKKVNKSNYKAFFSFIKSFWGLLKLNLNNFCVDEKQKKQKRNEQIHAHTHTLIPTLHIYWPFTALTLVILLLCSFTSCAISFSLNDSHTLMYIWNE